MPFRSDPFDAGQSGDTTAGGLRRISWLLKQPVSILLIELGGNDGLRGVGPGETEKNLQGIIDKAKAQYPNVRIVIAGMQMPANMGEEYTRRYRELFATVAKRNDAVLIPFLLEGVGGRAELNQPDRIHRQRPVTRSLPIRSGKPSNRCSKNRPKEFDWALTEARPDRSSSNRSPR